MDGCFLSRVIDCARVEGRYVSSEHGAVYLEPFRRREVADALVARPSLCMNLSRCSGRADEANHRIVNHTFADMHKEFKEDAVSSFS